MESSRAEEGRESVREEAFSGRVSNHGVLLEKSDQLGELQQSGYGETEGSKYILKDYEALYLMHVGKLKVSDKGKQIGFEELAERAQRSAHDAWTKFIIYRDLRSRGYVVKEGFGFGTDLRVYERGDFPDKAAKYVVFALDEGEETTVDQLEASIAQITRMGKEAIVAVIERRGEVIYYRVSRANFNR